MKVLIINLRTGKKNSDIFFQTNIAKSGIEREYQGWKLSLGLLVFQPQESLYKGYVGNFHVLVHLTEGGDE